MSRKSPSSKEPNNHLCLAKKISFLSYSSEVSCQYCFNNQQPCVVMSDYKKCVLCTHCEHSCVSVLWDSLDKTHNKLKFNILKVESEQSHLFIEQSEAAACAAAEWSHIAAEQSCVAAKLDRLHKTLCQTCGHTKEKTLCLLQELSDDEEAVKNPPTETLSQIFNAMPVKYWQQSNPSSLPQNIKVFSHSSWGFVWVPKLTLRYHILSISQDSELSH